MGTSKAAGASRFALTIERSIGAVVVGAIVLAVQLVGSTPSTESADAAPMPSTVEAPYVEPPTHRDDAADHDDPPAVVVLYGDSLAWEAREHFTAAFAGHPNAQVVTRTFGGTAICDWLDSMREDAAALSPTAVVVEFSGNAFTSCMLDSAGQPLVGDAYLARYRADAEAVVEIFEPTGTRVYFAGAPLARPSDGPSTFQGGRLNRMYTEIAAEHADVAEFVDAGAAVLDDGRWTNTLPCLENEPCEGGRDASGLPVNVVRAPDGGHFCPASEAARAGVTDSCPVWSSGALRYGSAMAAPLLASLWDLRESVA